MDTGADRTVFSAAILADLGLTGTGAVGHLGGVGGLASSILVDTEIYLPRDGGEAVFRGRFAAFTAVESLDMSVIGRDILNLFVVIIDRPQDVVCLLAQHHRYIIQP